MVTINVPGSSGGSSPSLVFPSSVGPEGPEGPPGTRSTDIGFTWPGLVPADIGTFAITVETEIQPDLCLAEATGTGVVSFSLDGDPIGTVTFPGADFDIINTTIGRGFLTFTASGTVSDLSLAIAGERS